MIEVGININREQTVKRVQAVRTYPTNTTPTNGQLCRYDVFIIDDQKEPISTLEFPYGSALNLSIALLNEAKEHYARLESHVPPIS